jgi:hypothetical protein
VILVSTAYLPPVEYFSIISKAENVLIERNESYKKQTYRNRCYLLSSHGKLPLSVPVLLGSFHKTNIKDIRIDYSKRWQQVHLRAMTVSYKASPFYDYYFENIESAVQKNHQFLLDLNTDLIEKILKILKLNVNISVTNNFEPLTENPNDYRYIISPKIESRFIGKKYIQVFTTESGFIPNLSIIDLIFNTGPEASKFL